MSDTRLNAFVRNSDLIGVGGLVLACAAPTLLVLSLTNAPWGFMTTIAFIVFLAGAALSFAVVVSGRRGRGAGIAGLVLSLVCSPIFVGLALITLAAE